MSETDLIRAELWAHNARARLQHAARLGEQTMIPVIDLKDFDSAAINRSSLNVLTVKVHGVPYECTRTPPNSWRVVSDAKTFVVTGHAGYLELALIQEATRRARRRGYDVASV